MKSAEENEVERMTLLPKRIKQLALKGLVLALLASTGNAWGSAPLYQGFTYQGRFLSLDGNEPMTDVVDLVIGIYSPNGNCLLYEERHASVDLSQTAGLFSVHVGSEIGNPKRVAGRDPGKSLSLVFSNSSEIRSVGANCAEGYTPSTGDPRKLRVTVHPHGGIPETMTPDLTITPVPQATVAETLQGLDPTKFVQLSGAASPYTLSKSAFDSLFGIGGVQDASSLHQHDSRYAQLGGDGSLSIGSGRYLGLGVRAANPDTTGWSADASKIGRTWFDSGTGEIKYWDGSAIKSLGISGAGVASFNSRTGAVTLSSADVTGALGFTPQNAGSLATDAKAALSETANNPIKYSAVSGSFFLQGGASVGDTVRWDGSQWQVGADSRHWGSNGTDVFRTTGNVGIGNSSPAHALDVTGAIRASTGIYLGSVVNVGGWAADFAFPTTGSGNRSTFRISQLVGHSGGNNHGLNLQITDSTSNTAGLGLITANLGGAGTGTGPKHLLDLQKAGVTKFHVSTSGNVGIGGASSASKLTLAKENESEAVILATSVNSGTGDSGRLISYKNSTGDDLFYVTGSGSVYAASSGAGFTAHEIGGYTLGGTWGSWKALGTRTELRTAYGYFLGNNGNPVSNTHPSTNVFFDIEPTINQSGTAGYTALRMNVVESAIGTGEKYLMDLQVGGSRKFAIKRDGSVGIGTTNPLGALDVRGGVASSGNGTALYLYAQDGFPSGNTNGGNIILKPGASSGSGKSSVGIGTATPSEFVEAYSYGPTYFKATSFSDYADAGIHLKGGTNNPGWKIMSRALHFGGSNQGTQLMFEYNGGTKITVLNNGNVGIGNSAPSYKLDIEGDVRIASASKLYVGTTAICDSGGCTSPSDSRYKRSILPLDGAEEKIQQLEGVTYEWIDRKRFNDKRQIGFLAQDVERVFPEVVKTDERTGFKSIMYDKLVAPLIEAFKALSARVREDGAAKDRAIAELEVKAAKLESENAEIRAKAEALTKVVCELKPAASICQ